MVCKVPKTNKGIPLTLLFKNSFYSQVIRMYRTGCFILCSLNRDRVFLEGVPEVLLLVGVFASSILIAFVFECYSAFGVCILLALFCSELLE